MSKVPPFAIGSDMWPGLAKLSEEMGELQQLVGKLMAFPDGIHPDGDGALAERFANEMADLQAGIKYVYAHNGSARFNTEAYHHRVQSKFERFQRWDGEERRRGGE